MGTGREREKGQPGFLPEEVEQSDCQVEMPTITDSHHPPLSAGPSHHAALVSFLSPCTNITGMKYEQSQHCNAWRWAGRGGMGALCRKPHHHNFASEVALQLGWLTGESAMLPSSLRRWSHAAVGRTACVLRLPLTSRMYVAPSAAVASVTTAPPSAPTQVRSGAVLRLLPHFWHPANSPPPLPSAHCPLPASRRASSHVRHCQVRPVRAMRLVVLAVAVVEHLPSVVGWAQPRLVEVVASHPAAPRPIAPAPHKRPAPWPTA